MRIIIGFLILIFGAFFTIKTQWFYELMGPVGWAERFLGAEGGSRFFYKLLGILICIVGLLVITNLAGEIIRAIFGPLFR